MSEVEKGDREPSEVMEEMGGITPEEAAALGLLEEVGDADEA